MVHFGTDLSFYISFSGNVFDMSDYYPALIIIDDTLLGMYPRCEGYSQTILYSTGSSLFFIEVLQFFFHLLKYKTF